MNIKKSVCLLVCFYSFIPILVKLCTLYLRNKGKIDDYPKK